MAQIAFYFSDREMRDLVAYALSRGFRFIPNLDYPRRTYEILHDVDAIVQCRRTERRLLWFLIRDDYSKWMPLPMHLRGGTQDKYCIDQKQGGPTIDLCWSGDWVYEDGKRIVIPGGISFYARFWNPLLKIEERATDEVRSAYSDLAKWVKSHSIRSDQPKGQIGAWIGPEAAKAWKRGVQLGHPPFLRKPKFVPEDG